MRVLVLLLCLAFPVSAAPPTLTPLYPAGGQQGKTAEITVSGTLDPWPIRAAANVKGIDLKPAKAKGTFAVAIAPDVPAGLYWVRLHNADGASDQRPFFVGSLPEVLEVEPNDDPKKPQMLSASSVVNGRLGALNDVDHFGIELKKGQTLVASLQANSILRSPMDAVLQVLSPDGFVVAENHDFNGLDPQIAFAVPSDGRYIVRLFAFPSVPNSSIRFFGSDLCIYRLTITTGGFADYAFPLAVALKEPTAVELRGWNIPESAKKIVLKPEHIADRFQVRHPEVANAVDIRIEPHPCIVEMEPNDRAQPQKIATPVTITGLIGRPREVDCYSFGLKKGERRTIRVEASSVGSALDPLVRIIDEAGKSLNEAKTANIPSDPQIVFAAPADGTYRVEVRDLYDHGGLRYFYRLRITAIEPTFNLAITADQFALKAGESLEIPVTVTRLDGFATPIVLRALDLPIGVESEPVKAEGPTKIVKLKLTATKGATSGAFRIEGAAGITANARFVVPAAGTNTDSIWLTIRPSKK